MKEAGWMAAASVLSAALIVAASGGRSGAEVAAGMAGPLLAAGGSWVLAERTFRRNPAALTTVMVAAFVGKMVFFPAYVVTALKVLALRPGPFVASFVGYFIALYSIAALLMRRLYGGAFR